VKVENQAEIEVVETQISIELSFEDFLDALFGFKFNNDETFD